MKKRIQTFIVLILSVSMMFTSINVYALDYDMSEIIDDEVLVPEIIVDDIVLDDSVATAEQVNNAMMSYLNAIDKSYFGDSDNFSLIEGLFSRGIPALGLTCSGTISALEALGIIKTPMNQGFEKILDGISQLNDKLDSLEQEVKSVSEEIKKSTKLEVEKTRQENAGKYLAAWQKFNTDYVEDMETISAEIQALTRGGIEDWWNRDNRSSIAVVYAVLPKYADNINPDTIHLAFSKASYGDVIPEKSDVEENILKDYSFVIPASCLPDTKSQGFDINNYESVFCDNIGKEAIKSAIEAKSTTANDAFYAAWAALSDEEKNQKASEYARDILKTVIYQENCRIMSAENVKIANYMMKYKQYCNNIQQKQSGVDAFIQNLYMTHGFEGQVKDDITTFCDSQIKNVGTYGLLIMTVADQCNKCTLAEKQELQNIWAQTITALDKKKANSLTGYDDFCYITGTRLSYEKGAVKVGLWADISNNCRYNDYYAGDYKLGEINDYGVIIRDISRGEMLSEQSAQVLYDQYTHNKDEDITFLQYLSINGVKVPEEGDVRIATDIANNPTPLYLSKGTEMKAIPLIAESFIENESSYKKNDCVEVNNIKKFANKYFVVHDFLKYDEVLLNNVPNGCTDDKSLVSRAFYGEHHLRWSYDEANIFYDPSAKAYFSSGEHLSWGYNIIKEFNYLRKIPVDELSRLGMDVVLEENSIDDSSPLVVFGSEFILKDVPDEEVIPYSKADWSSLKWDNLRLIGTGPHTDNQYEHIIDEAIEKAKSKGVNVVLSDAEKSALSESINNRTMEMEEELQNSSVVSYVNAFSVDGDDDIEIELASRVLPSQYFRNGKCIIPPENMTVVAEYEPYIFVGTVDDGGKPEITVNYGYEIVPAIVVWDTQTEDFEGFRIPASIYKALNMQMNVNIPVVGFDNRDSIKVSCYTSPDDFENGLDRYLEIKGDDSRRYVSLTTKESILYELQSDDVLKESGIRISKIPDQYFTGKALKPKVKIYDGEKLLRANVDYTVQYKNNVKAGTATVTIKGKGNYQDVVTDTFRILPIDIGSFAVTSKDVVVKAKSTSQKPEAKLYWKNKVLPKKYYTYKYYNADGSFNKIGEAMDSVVNPGRYVIEIRGREGFDGIRNINLTVAEKNQKLISKLKVRKINNVTYNNGEKIEPSIVVKDGNHVLTADEYSVVYKNNREVGTAKAIITGKGTYVGTKEVTFKIVGKPIKKAKVEGIPKVVTYTGNNISINGIKLIYDGNEIPADSYSVSYKKNVNVGKASILISGLKGYSGTIKKTFKIVAFNVNDRPEALKVSVSENTVEYSKGGAKPAIEAYFIKDDGTMVGLTEGKDYRLSYARNKAVNDGSNSSSAPVVKVKLKGNYKGTVTKNFAITSKNIDKAKVIVKDKVYKDKKGSYISTVTVYDTNGKKLTKNKDYDASIDYYANGVKLTKDSVVAAGTEVEVVIKAKQGSYYTGEVHSKYRIGKAGISKTEVTVNSKVFEGVPVVISGNDIKITAKGSDTPLIEGTDYVILDDGYSNNIRVGRATATIKGIGNYCGTKKIRFRIKSKKM